MLKDKILAGYRKGPLKFTVDSYNRELRNDQKAGAAFLCLQKRGILASPVGVGKTLEGTAAICKLFELGRIKSLLVMSGVSTLNQWVVELTEFGGLGVSLLDGGKRHRKDLISQGGGCYVATTNSVITDIATGRRLRLGGVEK